MSQLSQTGAGIIQPELADAADHEGTSAVERTARFDATAAEVNG
jgi:hypothetical protein